MLSSFLPLSPHITSQITNYQIDSRLITPNSLFFALPGAQTDGHYHLQEAAQRGALAAIVSTTYRGPDFGLALLPVEDVLHTLQTLASASLNSTPRPLVIGVTGSVGKTTTKELIAHLLSARFKVFKTPGNYNTKQTLPLSLLNRTGDEQILVLEMGMSEPGDIFNLVQIAPPDVAVLTRVGLSHAAFFPGGIEQIGFEKGRIFSHPQTKTAIFPHGFSAQTTGRQVTFSMQERGADYFLSELGQIDERGLRVQPFDLPFQESHFRYNFLIAAAVARELKMEWDEIAAQVATFKGARMRFERTQRNGVVFINDAYNANPESMAAALLNLPCLPAPARRIGVLGSMKELGSFSESAHRDIGLLAQNHVDHLLLLGEETIPLLHAFAESQKPAERFENHGALAARLKQLLHPGDLVLLKGSRSMELEKIFELLD